MEREVTTTELRVYLRKLANTVEQTQERITIKRHGAPIAVLVSMEDLAFLRKHKPRPTEHAVPDPTLSEQAELKQLLRDPETMDPDALEELVAGLTYERDWDIREWCARARRVQFERAMRGRNQANGDTEPAPQKPPSTGPPC